MMSKLQLRTATLRYTSNTLLSLVIGVSLTIVNLASGLLSIPGQSVRQEIRKRSFQTAEVYARLIRPKQNQFRYRSVAFEKPFIGRLSVFKLCLEIFGEGLSVLAGFVLFCGSSN